MEAARCWRRPVATGSAVGCICRSATPTHNNSPSRILQEAARLAEAEAARERAMIDEVVKRIMEEDMAEAAGKRSRQEETKAYIERFLAQQDELRRREMEAAAAEDRKIQGEGAGGRGGRRGGGMGGRGRLRRQLVERVRGHGVMGRDKREGPCGKWGG